MARNGEVYILSSLHPMSWQIIGCVYLVCEGLLVRVFGTHHYTKSGRGWDGAKHEGSSVRGRGGEGLPDIKGS